MKQAPNIYDTIRIGNEDACVVGVEDEPGGGFSVDYRFEDGEYGVLVVHPEEAGK